jgi:mRNA-degrading endonuclease RelE of RelBE toxin-antitoxin system
MVVKLEPFFIEVFKNCPAPFQEKFRKAYQQLKIVDHPAEIKGVLPVIGNKKFFKLLVDKSKIGMEWDGGELKIICFIFNQHYNAGE